MFTCTGSKHWTIKYNILSVTFFFFLRQLIISLVAILWESLSSALAHPTAINCAVWNTWPGSTNLLHAWALLTSKGLPHAVFTGSSPFQNTLTDMFAQHLAVGSQALLGHLSRAATQTVVSPICLVFPFCVFFLLSILLRLAWRK